MAGLRRRRFSVLAMGKADAKDAEVALRRCEIADMGGLQHLLFLPRSQFFSLLFTSLL